MEDDEVGSKLESCMIVEGVGKWRWGLSQSVVLIVDIEGGTIK